MTPKGYALADRQSRLFKARKIEALLDRQVAGLDLLDLGAGSGFLADYFQSRGAHVTAADRSDEVYASDIPLTLVAGSVLPFADASFDIIIFNHVIEHVGEPSEQQAILAEISRILKIGGKLYLAAPNKWAIIEPHYRLPLLGAVPRRLANLMVRLLRGDSAYDCYPMTRARLTALMHSCFPAIEDKSSDAIAWVAEHELHGTAKTMMKAIPVSMYRLAWPAYPTFIMVAEK